MMKNSQATISSIAQLKMARPCGEPYYQATKAIQTDYETLAVYGLRFRLVSSRDTSGNVTKEMKHASIYSGIGPRRKQIIKFSAPRYFGLEIAIGVSDSDLILGIVMCRITG